MSFIEVPNRHPEPSHRFLIRAGDVKRALANRTNSVVLGYFHTHPGDQSMSRPSTRDFYVAGRNRELLHAMYHPWSHALVWFDHTGVLKVDRVMTRIRGGLIL